MFDQPRFLPHWRMVQVNDLIKNGVILAQSGFAEGGFNEDGEGVPHLRPFNVTESGEIHLEQIKYVPPPPQESSYWLQPGDVVFNNTNSEDLVGKTAYFDLQGKFVFSNHMTLLRVLQSNVIDAHWLAQYLHFLWQSQKFKMLCRRYVGQASVSLQKLKTVKLQLPPIREQKAIAGVLQIVQEAIAARQQEATLERERKAALMQHLFTHGTRSEPMKDTPIGKMPKGWEVVSIGEIGRVTSGGTPSRKTPEYWNGGIPWVKTAEINYNVITSTEETISELGMMNSSAKMIPRGTLLMAMYGQGVTRGRVAILEIGATINQACAAILLPYSISTKYLFYYLAYQYENIRNLGHGANQRNLNAQLIKSILVALPDSNEQTEIANVVADCDNKIKALENEITYLNELFQAMLEQLMTGQLSARPLIE